MKKINNRTIINVLVVIIIILGIISFLFMNKEPNKKNEKINQFDMNNEEIKTSIDGIKFIVDPNKIQGGGPPKDGIPSIDNPKFVSIKEADKWISDNELVLAFTHSGIKRVYPLQILVWHEIVNDNIAGDPILITYCPLCGSGIAFERKIKINNKDVVTEFGTSGKLFNSNLVMYDRKTDSYWTQIEGKAIIGELSGQKLKELPIDTVVWHDWKTINPDSEVLSQDTGFNRNYGKDPYGNYYENSFVLFPVENEDNRIHPKTVIFGIEVNGKFKAYKEEDIKQGIIIDQFNNVNIKINRNKSGVIRIVNIDNNNEIPKERSFWFAWYAFHPDTELY